MAVVGCFLTKKQRLELLDAGALSVGDMLLAVNAFWGLVSQTLLFSLTSCLSSCAVVPLQVFANVAIIVLDEFTPAAESWFTWRDILHLVDIICCCAILFPIVWSIKHLRECSEIDGKASSLSEVAPCYGIVMCFQYDLLITLSPRLQAARNLVKLTLFRQFYVMVSCMPI